MVSAMDVVPGLGIDFAAVGRVLIFALVIYVIASALGYFQGRLTAVVVQRLAFRLREQVEAMLGRLPLSYFDRQQRGEVLSRATNDTDNIAQSMQQSMAQIVTSVLTMSAFGMFFSCPRGHRRRVVPASVYVAGCEAAGAASVHRAVVDGQAQQPRRGDVHRLPGRSPPRRATARTFAEHNENLYSSSFRAQFMSGIIQPAMMFIGNVNYVLVAVVGGLRVASGAISLGDVQAFIQYTRQFSQPLTQVAAMLLQSGIASERVFQLLDASEQEPDPAEPQHPEPVRGLVRFEGVTFSYSPDRPLIEGLSLTAEPGQTVAIVGPTGAGKTTLVNLLMRFYEVDRGRITLDGVDIANMSREAAREHRYGAWTPGCSAARSPNIA
jgi:ATP-binding cassette subfamily B protein